MQPAVVGVDALEHEALGRADTIMECLSTAFLQTTGCSSYLFTVANTEETLIYAQQASSVVDVEFAFRVQPRQMGETPQQKPVVPQFAQANILRFEGALQISGPNFNDLTVWRGSPYLQGGLPNPLPVLIKHIADSRDVSLKNHPP